jgi:hypothetical protein
VTEQDTWRGEPQVSEGEPDPEIADPEDPLAGIPTLEEFKVGALRGTLAQSRQQLANSIVNYYSASRIGGVSVVAPNGQQRPVHPGTIAEDIRKLTAHIELLEDLLRNGMDDPAPNGKVIEVASALPPADGHGVG